MSQKVPLVVGIAIIILGAGFGLWRWQSNRVPAVEEVSPKTVVTPPTPPKPTFVPVEEYATQTASIKATYASGRGALGANVEARLTQKEQYQQLVDATVGGLLKLSAPAEQRQAHQDRIIAFLGIQSLLKLPTPVAKSIQEQEALIDQSW